MRCGVRGQECPLLHYAPAGSDALQVHGDGEGVGMMGVGAEPDGGLVEQGVQGRPGERRAARALDEGAPGFHGLAEARLGAHVIDELLDAPLSQVGRDACVGLGERSDSVIGDWRRRFGRGSELCVWLLHFGAIARVFRRFPTLALLGLSRPFSTSLGRLLGR